MGLWELALKTTFVGHTQPQNDANYAYASDLSPFNSLTAGKLKCDPPELGGLLLRLQGQWLVAAI